MDIDYNSFFKTTIKRHWLVLALGVFFVQSFFLLQNASSQSVVDPVLDSISIVEPQNNQVLSGTVTLKAQASPLGTASSMDFIITPDDNTASQISLSSVFDSNLQTWTVSWDTTTVSDGKYKLKVEGIDVTLNTNIIESNEISVEVENNLSFSVSPSEIEFAAVGVTQDISIPAGFTLVTCESEDENVASVSINAATGVCTVTSVSGGKTDINLVSNSGVGAEVSVKVLVPIKFSLTFNDLDVIRDYSPVNGVDIVSCSSSDESIVKAQITGSICRLQSKIEGQALISLTDTDGLLYEVTATVDLSGTSTELSTTIDELNHDEDYELPSGIDVSSCSSADSSVLTAVEHSGRCRLNALVEGTVVVTIQDVQGISYNLTIIIDLPGQSNSDSNSNRFSDSNSSDQSDDATESDLTEQESFDTTEEVEEEKTDVEDKAPSDIDVKREEQTIVRIVNPKSGDKIFGGVILVAETMVRVDQLDFTVDRVSTNNLDFTFQGNVIKRQTGTQKGVWQIILDERNLPNGNYQINAVARIGVDIVRSVPINVKVESEVPTKKAVKVSQEIDSENVTGVTTLRAKTSETVQQLTFKVTSPAGRSLSILAIYDANQKLWLAQWNTAEFANGVYKVVAEAGKDVVYSSSTIEYKVQNQTPGERLKTTPEERIEELQEEVDERIEESKPLSEKIKEKITDTFKEVEKALPAQVKKIAKVDTKELQQTAKSTESQAKPKNQVCRNAGIASQEECAGYLAETTGVTITEEVFDEELSSFISEDDQKEITETLEPLVKKTVKLKRDSSTQELALIIEEADLQENLPESASKNIPLRATQETSVTILNSPNTVVTSDNVAVTSSPVLIIKDSDGDGLSDDAEKRLGTDPFSSDTDKDGVNDRTELLVDQGSLSPIDIAIINQRDIEQPITAGLTDSENFEVQEIDNDADSIVLKGKGLPNSTVTIYIYSYVPILVTVATDENGAWEYAIEDQLVDGPHETYVALNDESGKVVNKSLAFDFFVQEAQAVTADQFFRGDIDVQGETDNFFLVYFVGAAIIIALALLLVQYKRRREL